MRRPTEYFPRRACERDRAGRSHPIKPGPAIKAILRASQGVYCPLLLGVATGSRARYDSDMMKFQAQHFYRIGTLLGNLTQALDVLSATGPVQFPELTPQFMLNTLATIEKECGTIALTHSPKLIKDLRTDIATKGTDNVTLAMRLGEINRLIHSEMEESLFLWIPADRAAVYLQPLAGMEQVIKNYPSAQGEIILSSLAYSVGCFTASVFHQMRALEVFLAVISRELGVVKHSPTWGAYLSAFPKAIEAKFPNRNAADKEMQEFYNGVSAHLSSIKNAWRNPTMHEIAKDYTQGQALDIRHTAAGFMRHLNTKLKE